MTFIVTAPGDDAGAPLMKTLESLSGLSWPAKGAAIVTDPSGLPLVREAFGLWDCPGEEPGAPAPFNKRPFGLPAFCVAFSDAPELAESVNTAAREAGPTTDILVPLRAGDTVREDYCRLVVPHFEEELGVVGAVYSDRFERRPKGDLRVHEEPYSRERLLSRLWNPPASAFARFAFESVGGLAPLGDATEYDFWLKLTKTRVAVHVPFPLATTRSREPSDEQKRAAWRTAVELAGRREA